MWCPPNSQCAGDGRFETTTKDVIGQAKRILGERRARVKKELVFDVWIRGWCVEKKTGMSDLIGPQLSVAFDNASAHSQK